MNCVLSRKLAPGFCGEIKALVRSVEDRFTSFSISHWWPASRSTITVWSSCCHTSWSTEGWVPGGSRALIMLNNLRATHSLWKRDGRARQWREVRGLMEGWSVGLMTPEWMERWPLEVQVTAELWKHPCTWRVKANSKNKIGKSRTKEGAFRKKNSKILQNQIAWSVSHVCMYKCVWYLHFICWTRQMEDSFSRRFDGRPIGAQHRSEGSGARRRGWSLLVTDGEMEDSIRHAISQPGTPVRRDRLGPSISLHYL